MVSSKTLHEIKAFTAELVAMLALAYAFYWAIVIAWAIMPETTQIPV